MKKKLSLLVMFVFMFMGAVACKQPIGDITHAGNEKTENITGKPKEIEVKNIEYGSEEIFLQGKKLEQLTVTGEDDAFYCNLEENMKIECGAENAPVLVCKDPVYDITYYINYGRDNFIYTYRNGKTKLVVAIPARDLFCKEGELYFIADDSGRFQFSGFEQGNILKYNPKDGNVAVVVECSADRMIVYSDGICYEQVGEMEQSGELQFRTEESFFFSFATGESSPLPKNVDMLRRWRGQWLQLQKETLEFGDASDISELDPLVQYALSLGYTVAGVEGEVAAINLMDIQGTVQGTLQNVKGVSKEYWIGGDSIYYVEQREGEKDTESRSVLRQYDMRTGVHEDVAMLDYPTDLSFSDMILYNGVAYFGNGLRVALDDGAQCYMQSVKGDTSRLEYFYTDGEKLFCVSGGKLWLFEEKQETPLIEQEFVAGVPLEIGTYVYQLSEP